MLNTNTIIVYILSLCRTHDPAADLTIRSRNMGLCFDLGFLEEFLQEKIG